MCIYVLTYSLVRGPGIFGEVTVNWNITPPLQKEFAEISGTLTMRDRQSAAVVLIQVQERSIALAIPVLPFWLAINGRSHTVNALNLFSFICFFPIGSR